MDYCLIIVLWSIFLSVPLVEISTHSGLNLTSPRTCRLCHTRYLLIRKYIFYYVQLLVQYVLLADDTCIICYVQIMPNLMMYNYYMHIIIHFLLYFLRADYAGVLEVWPLQAANLRVPGPHVRGFQHHLTAPVHGVGPFLKVD